MLINGIRVAFSQVTHLKIQGAGLVSSYEEMVRHPDQAA
jgi:hypothetical protein